MPLERIIITFEKSGEFRGASATDFDGLPAHLDATELGKKITKLNAAAVARLVVVDAEITAKESEKLAAIAAKDSEKEAAIQAVRDKAEAAESALTAIESAIANPDVDDAATLEIAKAEVVKSKLSKRQKEKAAIQAQIDALKEQLKD